MVASFDVVFAGCGFTFGVRFDLRAPLELVGCFARFALSLVFLVRGAILGLGIGLSFGW